MAMAVVVVAKAAQAQTAAISTFTVVKVVIGVFASNTGPDGNCSAYSYIAYRKSTR